MYSIELASGALLELTSDDIAFISALGVGMPPIENISTAYGLADGALYQRTSVKPRVVTFNLDVMGSDYATLYDIRAQLVQAVNPHRGSLPVKIWYDHDGALPLYLNAHYDAGLEMGAVEAFTEKAIALRFVANDPYWHGEEEGPDALTVRSTIAAVPYIMHRTAEGVWGKPGTGMNNAVYVIAVAADGTVYAGGLFTTADGVNVFYVASWDGTAWAALGAGLGGAARAISFGPDGRVYVSGNFTTAGGSGANYVAVWNGAAWAALGAGLGAAGLAHAWSAAGVLYVGGSFTTAGGSGANYIASWDGAAWAALGAGLNGEVRAIAIAPNGDVYVGGVFTQAGGNAANKIARWDGAAWSDIGTGLDTVTSIDALAFGPDGLLYAGGNFNVAGGAITDHIAVWNGLIWQALADGLNGTVTELIVTDEGVLYASGSFDEAGDGRPLSAHVAYWANGIWLPESGGRDSAWTTVGALWTDGSEVWIGGTFNGSWYSGGPDTITNPGSARAYPVFTLTGPGRLYHIINYTTGQAIHFDLLLLDGETLTVDLRPGVKTITSSWRGNMITSIISGNLVDWYLAPGDNSVSVWVDDDDAGGEITYEPRYWSVDGVPAP